MYLCRHMRYAITILFAIIGFATRGEVYYFSADSVAVPDGDVIAVEVRAAHPDARVGEGRMSEWRFGWPGVNIALAFDYRDFIDGISTPSAQIICNGHIATLSKGLNTSGAFNSLAVEWQPDGRVHILAGERGLAEAMILDSLPKPVGAIRIGGGAIIQDVIIETNDNAFSRLKTDYLPEELEQARVWRYLDRRNDPKYSVIGGSYILAQVGNDLVYISGAKTNASHWQAGMLKGRLYPTGYDGYSKLEWYDATGRLLPGENFAEINAADGSLTLTFPELNASIRFSPASIQ